MYLFEAIRLGTLLNPQGFGYSSSMRNSTHTCAFGAARKAINNYVEDCEKLWPVLSTLKRCPECGETPQYPGGVISMHLNDEHKWTREQIATWLEPIELAYYQKYPEHKPKDVEEPKVETSIHDFTSV